MFSLTDIFEDSFDFEGNELNIDMTFDNILRMFELFDDDDFEPSEKILIALEILIIEYELIQDKGFSEQYELYNYVMKEFLDVEMDKEETKDGEETPPPTKKVMDFKKDAGLIYASFLSEFKMDLFECQGKLHWNKFSELLKNLNEKTAFKQVVGYRNMKVPSTKDASKEYRDHVQQMKRLYSLEDEAYQQESMESTLDTIASTFGGGAKK